MQIKVLQKNEFNVIFFRCCKLMYFFIQRYCFGRSSHSKSGGFLSKYILEIIYFKQLVHAINICWALENIFKLHKRVKFSKKKKERFSKKKKPCQYVKKERSNFVLRVLIKWNEHTSKGKTPCFQKIRGFCFTFWLSSKKKMKICICFKEVYSIKKIVTVSALQTGQPASVSDPTYHVNVFIQQPITLSEQLPHLADVTAFLRTCLFLDTF